METDKSPLRDRLVQRLRVDLIGPREDEEVLISRPSDVYLTGVLWPPRTHMGGEEDEKLGVDGAGDDSSDDEGSAVSTSSVQKPSVAGLSFCVKAIDVATIAIDVEFARYFAEAGEKKHLKMWRRQQVRIHIDEVKLNGRVSTIELGNYAASARGVSLYIRCIATATHQLVTVSIVNAISLKQDDGRNAAEEATLFQTYLKVTPKNQTHLISKPPRRLQASIAGTDDHDQSSNLLLFRKIHEYAVGHVCAAMWGPVTSPDCGDASTEFVETSWVPSATVPGMNENGHDAFNVLGADDTGVDCLSAEYLATASETELAFALDRLCACYQTWLKGQQAEFESLTGSHRETATCNLDICQDVLDRMLAAAKLVCSDERLRRAFQLANLAMHVQHGWDAEKAKRGSLRWRPFQLAFLLMSSPSAAVREHPDRGVMDLLWFPTGGGKTEAYLALIALVAFYRRLSDDVADHSGVAALMRYTLRLLTTQQFARSAAMILACEAIRTERVKAPAGLKLKGRTAFSIGLWVGGDASPNKRAIAAESLRGSSNVSSPKQLANCPKCHNALFWDPAIAASAVQPICKTKECLLAGPLPVWTVDQDVYEQCPTLLVGTIDKFAQIVRRAEVNDMFGVTHGAPPDLVLQDELHLISGPLGTIAGLYETAFDMMWSARGTLPKVIGSTATIRRAEEQVRDLFDRTACQFPPPALNQSDSGFAVVAPEKTGRRYVGVTTAGRSAKFTLQAVSASLLQSASAAFDSDEERDPYHTLVGYFNSLRELGGALILMQDDVNDGIGLIRKARSEDARPVRMVEELTSRRTQDEILGMLEGLAIKAGQAGAIDVVLATNMVSVGVDIPRLGLMVVNGQPKTVAEYIQSTSRVGRGSVSGLVVTILNNAKARDRSHFESFSGWHASLYRDVEATSVTPFASRARDRALHAALVAAVRHLGSGMLNSPEGIDNIDDEVSELIDKIVARANRIDPEETRVRWELERKVETWRARAPKTYWNDFQANSSLLQSAEKAARDRALGRAQKSAWPTLNSMRNVEAGTPFRMAERLKLRDEGNEE